MADYRSASAKVYRRWYKTARWTGMRLAQLMASPLCVACLSRGDVREASVADHVRPHRGNAQLFFDPDNLQSLCARCHDVDKQREERGLTPFPRFGLDGWPIG